MAASSGTEGVVLGTNEYKVIIIGAVGVGKTSLLVRYVYNTFEESSMKVISEEKKKITISGQEVVLDLWDTAGQERFRTLTQRYYDNVDGVLVVYSCEDEDSFSEIERYWFPEIARYVTANVDYKVPILIVENKKDLIAKGESVLNFEHTKEMAHQKNLLPPLQCSAKDGSDDVKKVFHVMASEIHKVRRQSKTTKVTTTTKKTSERKCCGGGTKKEKKNETGRKSRERLTVRET